MQLQEPYSRGAVKTRKMSYMRAHAMGSWKFAICIMNIFDIGAHDGSSAKFIFTAYLIAGARDLFSEIHDFPSSKITRKTTNAKLMRVYLWRGNEFELKWCAQRRLDELHSYHPIRVTRQSHLVVREFVYIVWRERSQRTISENSNTCRASPTSRWFLAAQMVVCVPRLMRSVFSWFVCMSARTCVRVRQVVVWMLNKTRKIDA